MMYNFRLLLKFFCWFASEPGLCRSGRYKCMRMSGERGLINSYLNNNVCVSGFIKGLACKRPLILYLTLRILVRREWGLNSWVKAAMYDPVYFQVTSYQVKIWIYIQGLDAMIGWFQTDRSDWNVTKLTQSVRAWLFRLYFKIL